jgi:hypothetical protein
MRRLLSVSILALAAFTALAGSAFAATPRSVITSFSPAQVAVNGVLVIKGKNFASGVTKNRVFFSRASDGKTVRARPSKATKTRIEVIVPSAITRFLADNGTGGKKATRFQIAVFTKLLGKYTAKSRSPIILPVGVAPITGAPGGPGALPPGATAADCDGDGIPNTSDTDDDNDLLPDTTEAQIGTDPCKADSDGDGIPDGYEYYSALDLNGNNLPYPGTKPFPNPLDGSDAAKDFDRDGLTDGEEYAAWAKFGNSSLPMNYSAGNANSGGAPSDGLKDADGDGLNNLQELAKQPGDSFNPSRVPTPGLYQLNWLNSDSDGDTIPDGADDQDHDGLSNIEEVTLGADGLISDPEDPASPGCNATDPTADIDGDGLSNGLEAQIKTNPCNKDTDGDGVQDGYEYWAARDLNANALPYPGKKPYPNALDGGDAGKDFDGDGLTMAEEFAAWNLYGGRVLPTGPNQSFPYSDGNQTSTAPAGLGGTDYDQNGKITDDEKDADGDGLANWVELARGGIAGRWTDPNGTPCAFVPNTDLRYQDCGLGAVPNGDTFVPLATTFTSAPMPAFVVGTNWLDPDTDGDGVNDLADDQDHDDFSNGTEITNQTNPVDPCAPDTESRTCPQHP